MLCVTFCHSSFSIILIGERELLALLSLSSWCIVVVVRLFLTVPWICLQFVIVVFPDDTHLLFLYSTKYRLVQISVVAYAIRSFPYKLLVQTSLKCLSNAYKICFASVAMYSLLYAQYLCINCTIDKTYAKSKKKI